MSWSRGKGGLVSGRVPDQGSNLTEREMTDDYSLNGNLLVI